MKIIYVNCGLKNYMKVDHCSYRRNYNFAVAKRKPERIKFRLVRDSNPWPLLSFRNCKSCVYITAMIHSHTSIFILLWFCKCWGRGVKVSVSVSHVDFFPWYTVGRVSWSFDKGQQHQPLLNFIRDGAFEF